MDIYELSVDSSNASEFVFPIPEQKERFIQIIEEKISNGLSVKNEWEDFIVVKRDPKIEVNFYDFEDKGVYIVDEQVYKMVSPAFNQSIEVLPLKSDDQTYHLLNVIETTDCLDKENSTYTEINAGQIMEYEELSFFLEKITCPFFRIPEMPFITLITEDVVELYHSQMLKGLHVSEAEYLGET